MHFGEGTSCFSLEWDNDWSDWGGVNVSIAVVGGKLRFLPGRPRDLWHCICRHSFCFLGANYCNIFYDCGRFGHWERFLLMRMSFFFPFLKSLV